MKKLIALMLVSVAVVFASGCANMTEAKAPQKQKVVYHINGDDPKQQKAALGNIQNHINAVGAENLDLRVVMHGNGLSLVMYPDAAGKNGNKMKQGNATDDIQAKITTLKGEGVQFKVCANTLKGRNISTSDIYDFSEADVVPSGVAELGILQAQGFAYVKP